MASVEPTEGRYDWFSYYNPDPIWLVTFGRMPGVQIIRRFGVIHSARLHRTHLGSVPGLEFNSGSAILASSVAAANKALRIEDELKERSVHLRPYQQVDLPKLLEKRSSLLAYEMRLGKTPLACASHDSTTGALVVVGPLIARDVWSTWIERIHGEKPILISGRQPLSFKGFPSYFVHYDVLDAHVAPLVNQGIGTLIFDECHMLQSRKAKKVSACTMLRMGAKRILGLSGTPMWSQPRSMWPLLNLLSPGAWGSMWEFTNRYTNVSSGSYGNRYRGIANEEELKERLSHLVIRRTWSDVQQQLPPITNVVEPVELNSTVKNSVEQLAYQARLAYKSEAPSMTMLSALRQAYGLAKVPRAVELARDAVASGHKVVIWHWHKEVGNEIHVTDHACYHITSDTPQDRRQSLIDQFQRILGPCAIVMPLAIGGVGIDLSSADVNIFVELDWIPSTNAQAAMRIFSPNRPHSNHFLFCDTPIERRLVEVLGCNEACQRDAGLSLSDIASIILDNNNGR